MTSAEIREKYLKFFESRAANACRPPLSSPTTPRCCSLVGMGSSSPTSCTRRSSTPHTSAPLRCRSACAPTTSTISAMLATCRSSRCWATSASAATSSKRCAHGPSSFSTEVLGLPKDKLYFTVFEDDDETIEIWKSLGVAEDHISRLGEDDNFWRAGLPARDKPVLRDLLDQGPEVGCGSPTAARLRLHRLLEYWNCVFTQYDRPGRRMRRPA